MNKRIYLEEIDNRFLRFNFLNGSIDLDQSATGSFAICPGCGSGKTTLIKELIKLKWSEGILYTAFTIDEVNNMYQFCKSLVGLYDVNTNETLKIDDIIVLHSDYESEGTDSNLWRNNPEELMNKKIILCTHHKLLNEPFHLLISAKFNKKLVKRFPPTYRTTHSIDGDIPRQWILIDEMPESSMYLAELGKNVFSSLGIFTNRIKIIKK